MRIEDDNIPNPVAFVNELQGGAQSSALLTDRDAVPIYYRQWGMFFTVYNDGANNGTYVLTYGKNSTTITDNTNWVLFAGGGSKSIQKIDQVINNTGSITIPPNCFLLAILVNAAADLPVFNVGYTSGAGDLVMTQDASPGYNTFNKGIYIPGSTTIFFSGVAVQSTCSVIIATF